MLFLVLLLLLALALLAWYYLLEQLKNPNLRKQLLQKNLYERPSLLAHSWLKSETSGAIREKHPLPKLRRS
ncbi:MAG: hypothetical protein IJS50_00725, partial [Desulfovibrio sp.]|nr:hypothetical protein [Desulfovibrio sp.]